MKAQESFRLWLQASLGEGGALSPEWLDEYAGRLWAMEPLNQVRFVNQWWATLKYTDRMQLTDVPDSLKELP